MKYEVYSGICKDSNHDRLTRYQEGGGMAKSIAFIGVPSRDIIYYVGRLLRICGQEVLIVTYQDGEEKEYQPSYYMGLDWLTCSKEWVQVHEEIIRDYSYVLYELDFYEVELYNDRYSMFDYIVGITTLYKNVMQELALAILRYNKQCILIVRDICSKRLDSNYFLRNYPDCKELCRMSEIWIDSYDTYYKQCLELEERINFKRMSEDMSQSLSCILRELQILTNKEIQYAIKQLKKGVVEC